MTKRLFDFSTSLAALMVLLPVLCVLALVVRLKIGTPIFFNQTRPGLLGKPFTMVKFRTMTDERGPDGALLPDAQRLTPFGRFLRSSSLDELPELWNVLKGDMSLVGPRPLLMEYLDFYTEEEKLRHSVRPGITGLAQIMGRNVIKWNDRLAYDVEYVKTQTLWLDIKILVKTLRQVLKRQGVVVVPSELYQKLSEERREQK
jgi:lipopolysaccharide/colanic/teichoic acid biosynthesis glycosyltransferase